MVWIWVDFNRYKPVLYALENGQLSILVKIWEVKSRTNLYHLICLAHLQTRQNEIFLKNIV